MQTAVEMAILMIDNDGTVKGNSENGWINDCASQQSSSKVTSIDYTNRICPKRASGEDTLSKWVQVSHPDEVVASSDCHSNGHSLACHLSAVSLCVFAFELIKPRPLAGQWSVLPVMQSRAALRPASATHCL